MVKVKQINDAKDGDWIREQNKVYDPNGLAPMINKGNGGNLVPKIQVKSATQSGYEEAKEGDSINYSVPNSKTRRGRVGVGVAQTLDTQVYQGVLVHNITKTVSVRKYEVDIEKLKEVLKQNKKISIREISEKLNITKTKVEHWFRTDDSFSIPDPNYWFELKNVLNITTNEFDESIMTFEEKDNVFEKSNRVYDTKGISPTLTSTQKGEQILTQQIVASRVRGENNEQSLEPNKEGVSNSLTGVQKDNLLMEGYSIRRLTEIECERLQGFPLKEIKISICLENQKKNANVDNQNHKLQKYVSVAEEKESNQNVSFADQTLNTNNQLISKPVQQIVHINLEDSKVEILNQEKLIWSAGIVETKKQSALLTQIENFVLLIVLIKQIQEKIVANGGEELQVNEQYSIHQQNGEMLVKLYGNGIMQLVKDVEIDSITLKELLKYTILDHLNLKNIEQILTTLYCYAYHVITGFIQTEIQQDNLLFQITLRHGWTKYGMFDGQVKEISRTQRYKMCGNAVTVCIVELIGKKLIQAYDTTI